ncbi:MAG: hypothetical protein EBV03_11370, partial [Proteobacteria bacterium]|nr:hypothetical protein [Pseudomonadota bacterium]
SEEVKQITWSMVTQAVKLSKLQLRNVVKLAGYSDITPEQEVPTALLVKILLADMLEQLAFLTAEQRMLVLDETLGAQNWAATQTALIVFVDGRYCTWSNYTGFLVLDSGENIRELPHAPIETISYNLQELLRRGRRQIEKRSGLHAKQQNADGNVEKPADVRDCAADGVS